MMDNNLHNFTPTDPLNPFDSYSSQNSFNYNPSLSPLKCIQLNVKGLSSPIRQ